MTECLPSFDRLLPLVARGLDKASAVLAAMLDAPVGILEPELSALRMADLGATLGLSEGLSLSAVEMSFAGDIEGSAQLIFLSEYAGRLADCVAAGLGLAPDDVVSVRDGTLCEVGNIVINAILGTIANDCGMGLSYTVPLFIRGGPEALLRTNSGNEKDTVILIRARFQVASVEVAGDIAFFFSLDSIEALARSMEGIIYGIADG